MKKYLLLPLLCLFLACSEDEGIVPQEAEPLEDDTQGPVLVDDRALSGYTLKEFNTNNGFVTDSTFYALDGDRIVASFEINRATQEVNSSTHSYNGRMLMKTTNFYNGEMTSERTFTYGSNGLTEMLLRFAWNRSFQYYKYSYTHTADSIYLKVNISQDGLDFDRVLSEAKMVLDENENLVFFENYNHESDRTFRVHYDYDVNQNLISEVYERVTDNGVIPYRTDNLTYNEMRNPNYNVLLTTYGGKKTLMMLYPLQVNDISQINARVISPNAIVAKSSSASDNRYTFEISNELGENGFSELSNYKTYEEGNLSRHFEIEFVN